MFKEEEKSFEERYQTLTDKEKMYFSIMRSKSGVLKISSKPGVAKSAISRSIAKKMGYDYKDIRLTMIDETDLGLYPDKTEMEFVNKNGDKSKIKVLDFIVPRWAFESNLRPTIIHFEELNRASLQVRNAALQILLERQIGNDFFFNENVLMMCSGNLGEEDGTDVEELDSALNNRLIHVEHKLSTEEWINGYAEENIHPIIVEYIKSNPDQLYKADGNSPAYATPRSWTFLSDFIVTNFGKESTSQEFLPTLRQVCSYYIGNSSVRFIRYCSEMIELNIQDVISNFPSIKDKLSKFNRDRKSDLLQSLRSINLNKLNKNEMENIIGFLTMINDDERASYLLFIFDKLDDRNKTKNPEKYSSDDPNIVNLLLKFEDFLNSVDRMSSLK